MAVARLDDLICSLKTQIGLDVDHIEALKAYFKDEGHPCVIEATQQLKMQRVLLRLLEMPVEHLLEVIHMDDPELIRQALKADDLNDITLVHQVLESAEQVANGEQFKYEFTVLTMGCVYYLAPLLK